MEKPTKTKQNVDRMMARLEGRTIHDPMVKMILEEVSKMYGSIENPDFEMHYLDSPMEFKYRVHFSTSIFYQSYAVMLAQICRNIGVDAFRRKLEEAIRLRGIVAELSDREITALLFAELWETEVPYEVGIQIAGVNYPEAELRELEDKLSEEFRFDFSQTYEYGDPDFIQELVSKIKTAFKEGNPEVFQPQFRVVMFKRILDRNYPDLFYRWIVIGHKPKFKGIVPFSDYLFGDY